MKFEDILRSLGQSPVSAPSASLKFQPAPQVISQDEMMRRYNFGTPTTTTTPTKTPPTGGGTNRAVAPTNTTPAAPVIDEQALAEARRRSMIDSYRAQANNLRNEGQGTFDNIIKAVNAFRDRSKEQFTNAGQEIVNRASQILGENGRNNAQQEGQLRAKGRALGLGDSSKFNLQSRLAGNFAATQGNTIAKRGEEDRANTALLNERNDQAQNQENQANTYLKGVRDRATALENAGYNAADETYASTLNDIVNYQRQLAAINPLNAKGLTQYTPNFSGIANTINSVLQGLSGAGGGTITENDFANPVDPTNIFDILKKRGLVTG